MLDKGPYVGGCRFQMELQGDDVSSDLERLVLVDRAAGQPDGSGGEIEGFPVPVEDETLRGKLKARRNVRHPMNPIPADFRGGSTIDTGAESARDQLGAQTDTQHRDSARHGIAHERLLGPEPGECVLVVDAHRPAQRDERVDSVGPRQRVAGEQPGHAYIRPLRLQAGPYTARTFERDVLEESNLLHPPTRS